MEGFFSNKLVPRKVYDGMLQGLSANVGSLLTVNLDSGEILFTYADAQHFCSDQETKGNEKRGGQILNPKEVGHTTLPALEDYLYNTIHPNDVSNIRRITDTLRIGRELENNEEILINYRARWMGPYRYFQTKITKATDFETSHTVVFGTHCVDAEVRREMETQKKLSAALDDAKAANDAKANFLLEMSHDLRTPMNAVLGFVKLAQECKDPVEQKELLGQAESSGQYLMELLNNVLQVANLETDKVDVRTEPASITQMMDNLDAILRQQCREKRITLSICQDIEHDDVRMDSVHVKEALLNVAMNAVKYTRAGGFVNIFVTERPGDKDSEGKYCFSVKDNGVGMSSDFLKKVYDPFTRAKSSTECGVLGLGIGMTITKKYITALGGEIEIFSEPGEGTEVKIYLAFEQLAEKPGFKRQAFSTDYLQGRRILIVDDNRLNLSVAKRQLKLWGIETEVADDGDVAVVKVSNSEPGYYDAVLMDILMPKMDGYEATRRIRSLSNHVLANIPVIALTANNFEKDIQRSLDVGMNDHIGKPFNPDQLFESLCRIIGSEEEYAAM